MSDAERQRAQLADDLRRLGVEWGGVLLMHSSLSALGWVEGGAETVILALLDALGPEGTLLLPALSYETVGAHHPHFDVRRTPSCVGRIAEHFRTRPGTLRSVHPTHSVCAVGPLADELLHDHILDVTPVGPNSPFRKLWELEGQVLFLGCGLRPNTSMHGVEELVNPPYLYGDLIHYTVVLADGRSIELDSRHHGFRGYTQRYDRLGPLLEEGSELRVGPVLAGTAHLLQADALWSRALAQYQRDPLYFVDPRPSAAH